MLLRLDPFPEGGPGECLATCMKVLPGYWEQSAQLICSLVENEGVSVSLQLTEELACLYMYYLF